MAALFGRLQNDVAGVVLSDDLIDEAVRNPFTAGERIMMMTKTLVDLELVSYAVPIEDLNRNAVWVSHVQSMSPRFDVAFSNNPLVVRLFEEAGIEVRQSPMYHREEFEGAEVRERMATDGDWESLVPSAVVEVIEEIDGVDRLQQISASDANGDGDPADE